MGGGSDEPRGKKTAERLAKLARWVASSMKPRAAAVLSMVGLLTTAASVWAMLTAIPENS